jgi:hypothetical protein
MWFDVRLIRLGIMQRSISGFSSAVQLLSMTLALMSDVGWFYQNLR